MLKWKLLTTILTAGIATTSANAQQSGARPSTLTALDYIEIQQLNARYAFALDNCPNNGYDYADLYTPDGVFTSGLDGRRYEGREKLAEAAGGGVLGCKNRGGASLRSHTIVNVVIEPSPEGATGKSYLVYPGVQGKYQDANHSGHIGGYQDVYVKTPAGWRFKSRVHVYPPQVPGNYRGTPNTKLGSQPAASAERGDTTPTLTVQDGAEIQQLVARYAFALNSCEADEYASLFISDGVFISDDFRGSKHREMYGPNGGKLVGRAKLAELVRTEEFCRHGGNTSTRNASRPLPTVAITPSPEGATGRIPLANDGRYEDVYVKTSEGWRFKSRTVVMPKVTAQPVQSGSAR
jgi:hypothetical protein